MRGEKNFKNKEKYFFDNGLTVAPDAVVSRPGRDVASVVVGRLPLVARFEAAVVDVLLAVAGREATTQIFSYLLTDCN